MDPMDPRETAEPNAPEEPTERRAAPRGDDGDDGGGRADRYEFSDLDEQPPRRPVREHPRWQRRFARVLGILFGSVALLVSLVLIAALVLTNTDWGRERTRRLVLGALEGVVHGHLRIGSIEGNLFTGVMVNDLSITDSAGRPFVAAERARVRYSIRNLLKKRLYFHDVLLTRPVIVLDRAPGGGWNYERIFPRDTATAPSTGPSWGSWLAFENVGIKGGRVVVRLPWTPGDSLRGAARDSAIAYALSSANRSNVVRATGGYQKVMTFGAVDASLPHVVVKDPDSTAMLFEVAGLRAAAEPFRPPSVQVRGLIGTFRVDDDSVWWGGVRAWLPGTKLADFAGRYTIESGDMRLRMRGEQVALADLRWLYPRIPADGGGRLALFDLSWTGGVQRYTARGAELATGGATIAGDFGLTLADTGLAPVTFNDTRLRVAGLDTRLIEQMVPDLALPRRGTLGGRVAADGPLAAMRVDGDVTFDDTRSGRSRVVAVGTMGFDSTGFRANELRVRALPVQVDLARIAMPTLPIGGTVTGLVTLTGSSASWIGTAADLVHEDRGATSHVVGRGEVRLGAKPIWMDFDLQAQPVSLVTVGRFAPAAGLRGAATGPIRIRGPLSDLRFLGDLALTDGGALRAQGRVDLASAQIGYDVDADLKLFNAHAVVERAPRTEVTATLHAAGRGFDPATMRGDYAADFQASSYDSVAVDAARLRVRIADGLANVDTVMVRATGATIEAGGAFGMTGAHAGELAYRVAVDSLQAFARWLPRGDSGVVQPRPAEMAQRLAKARADSAQLARATEVQREVLGGAAPALEVDSVPTIRRDSIAGSVYAAGVVRGSIAAFDLRGRAAAQGVVFGGNTVRRMRSEYAWTGARTPQSNLAFAARLDSLSAAGFHLDSVDARLTYQTGSRGTAVVLVNKDENQYGVRTDYVLHTKHTELHLDNLRLQFDTTVWASAHPGAIDWGEQGIKIDTLELRNQSGGRVYVNGLLPTSTQGAASLELAIDGFEIADILSLLQSDFETRGLLSVNGRVQGTTRDPRVAARMGVQNAVYKGTALPDLRAELSYANADLRATATAQRGDGAPIARVAAQIPVNLAAGATGPRFSSDSPIAVDLDADSLPLEVLPRLTDAVANVQGRAIGSVRIRGSMAKPRAVGALTFDLGSFKVVATGMQMRDIAGVVHLVDDSLVVDSLIGHARGQLRLSGGIGFAKGLTQPTFDLRMVGTNGLRVLNNEMGRIDADAQIAMYGPMDGVNVSGLVHVLKGVYYLPPRDNKSMVVLGAGDPAVFRVADTSLVSTKEILPAQSPLLSNLRLNINVRVNQDMWVRSPDMNVEVFTDGDLIVNVDRRNQAMVLEGIVNSSERSDYTFMSKRFHIVRGSAQFTGGAELNPLVQATAEYEVKLPGREALNIRLLIGGTLRRPRLTLESDAQPPISQTDLLSYLAFGRQSTSLVQSEGSGLTGGGSSSGQLVGAAAALATNRLAGVALGVAINELESRAARSFGLDVINITPSDLQAEIWQTSVSGFVLGTEIEAGKYINSRLFVGGLLRPAIVTDLSKGFPGARAQYRLTDTWRMESSFGPRYLLQEPSLEPQALPTTLVWGLFLVREWRF